MGWPPGWFKQESCGLKWESCGLKCITVLCPYKYNSDKSLAW
jgi:hypothetical protein